MTLINITTTVIIGIAILVLVIIPIFRILLRWKYFNKLSLVTEREPKKLINTDDIRPFNYDTYNTHPMHDDFIFDPTYSNIPGNIYYMNDK